MINSFTLGNFCHHDKMTKVVWGSWTTIVHLFKDENEETFRTLTTSLDFLICFLKKYLICLKYLFYFESLSCSCNPLLFICSARKIKPRGVADCATFWH